MKIVSIAASFVPANTANSIQVIKATHALVELGYQVTLLVPGQADVSWETLKHHYGLQQDFEIRWIRENLAFRRYDFAFKALRAARQLSPDLIYTWVLQAGVLALWGGLPVILELHDRVSGRFGPWLFKRFCTSPVRHRLLTNTEALSKVLQEDYRLDASAMDVRVAPNGVDLVRYQGLPAPREARQALNLPQGFTAGYTGHFYAGRGMGLMMDLAKTLPAVHFLWVGGDPSDVALWKARLAAEDVHNVTLTGFIDNAELPKYQAAADVLLMPYGRLIAGSGGGDTSEVASPMKMFEYLAAGRPILSSDLPVIREVLSNKIAMFCPPGDLKAWKSTLSELKENPSKRAALAAAARKAAEKYSWRARAKAALKDFL